MHVLERNIYSGTHLCVCVYSQASLYLSIDDYIKHRIMASFRHLVMGNAVSNTMEESSHTELLWNAKTEKECADFVKDGIHEKYSDTTAIDDSNFDIDFETLQRSPLYQSITPVLNEIIDKSEVQVLTNMFEIEGGSDNDHDHPKTKRKISCPSKERWNKQMKDVSNKKPRRRKRKRGECTMKVSAKKIKRNTETPCIEEGDKTQQPKLSSCVDTLDQIKWEDYCHLPMYPPGVTQRSKKKGCVVSVEDRMVYCGPLDKNMRTLLTFKAKFLCDIMKDPHSPPFRVSGNVLMFPLGNYELLTKWPSGEVYEMCKPALLEYQGKQVFGVGAQPPSIFQHCLLRYILDIGNTGLSYFVLDGVSKTYINWHLDHKWGNTRTNCTDRIVQFFENRMQPENRLLLLRCKVLQQKESLLTFLNTLLSKLSAIDKEVNADMITQDFAIEMKNRVMKAYGVLCLFQNTNLLDL